MEPLGLGMDIIEIERVRGVHERHGRRFLERVYCEPERRRALELRDPSSFLAGRFAAKEAVLKVLGTGLSGGISWQDVVVLREASGAPRVYLRGRAFERASALGIGLILVSISHARELAIAQAMGFRGDPGALRHPSHGP
ncbi:MAG TPA: holo-ACP synthase [Planctomycetota bacterium]|nr:holo-ACP synthase [Planctomycetota bacterium]